MSYQQRKRIELEKKHAAHNALINAPKIDKVEVDSERLINLEKRIDDAEKFINNVEQSRACIAKQLFVLNQKVEQLDKDYRMLLDNRIREIIDELFGPEEDPEDNIAESIEKLHL